MGEVIVGMPGPWADDNSERADHYTTKIGGLPDWPCPESIISPSLLSCDSCGKKLCLVAQIYAPISTKIMTTEERVIYIFTCVATACETKRWRALRVQRSFNNKESNPSIQDSSKSPLTTELQDDSWGFNFDEEDDEIDLDSLGKALTEATNLASASKPKKQNTCLDKKTIEKSSPRSIDDNIDKTSLLPCFYIYTQEEDYAAFVRERNESLDKEKYGIDAYEEARKGDHDKKRIDASEEVWEGESYEYDKTLNSDRIYLKFKKRLDAYPEQCFRYLYGGKPLLATVEAGDPGRCLLCGESRHYEMQLMPPLLYFLQEATNNKCSLENWNWMSVIVYTCSKGCAPSSKQGSGGWVVAEEAIVVQTE